MGETHTRDEATADAARGHAAREHALAATVVSAFCFGTLAVLGALAYREGAEPLPLLAWRFVTASLLLAAYQSVRAPGSLRVPLRDAGRFVLVSWAGHGLASMCFFLALRHADASIVGVLLYTYPAIVAVASAVLWGERIGLGRTLALVVTFVGCALVVGAFGGVEATSVPGILLGLGAGLGYGSFTLLSSRFRRGHPRSVMLTYVLAADGVLTLTAALLTGADLSPVGWSPALWGLLAAIILVPTFAALLLYFEGIDRLGASQAAIVSTFEPAFTVLLAWVLLGERLGALQLLGAFLVLAGVVLAERRAAAAARPAAV